MEDTSVFGRSRYNENRPSNDGRHSYLAMDDRLKIGAVSYLNAKPLVYRLPHFVPQAELVYDVPSRLALRLAAGRLDVAMIPSVEYLGHPEYSIASDACIACRGPVLSVKLFCRVAPERIRLLALDEGSRSSAVMAKILLWEQFGLRPRSETLPLGARVSDTPADAVLLIGDRAIQATDQGFAQVWDLGDQWYRWTELPFVFAMWIARAGVNWSGVDAALAAARDCGVAHLPEIAAAEAVQVGLDASTCLEYLRDNLHFVFGAKERAGLEHFHRHAARLGLVPARPRGS